MAAAPTPPWLYLEIAAAVLTLAAWVALALWFRWLPVLPSVAVAGIVLVVAAGLGGILPLLGHHAAPWLAADHLVSAAAFLAFNVTLGLQLRLAAAQRRPPGGQEDTRQARS